MSKFRASYVFSNGMVLQRRKPICVFGWGEDGQNVTVSLEGDITSTVVEGGSWKVYLKEREASEDLKMTITSGTETITFSDIAVGEVWLAGGQSNMEFELQNAVGGVKMLENDHPNVRFYYTPKIEWEDSETIKQFEESHWQHFSKTDAANWSAVGYLFGKRIAETLGVTVGVIGCNWGGTSASAWMPEEDLENAWPDVRSYIEDFRKGIEGQSLEQQKADYLDYVAYRADWEPKCNKMFEENPDTDFGEVERILGSSRYPGPINSFSPFRPCGLYHIMLEKVISYSMAGVIYYQGESDDHKPEAYYNLFSKLVERWRKDNGDLKLPFLAVSLPMHRFRQDPDFKNWPVIRENQRKVSNNQPFMGLAVATDCGTFNEIHPKDKRAVADRLALQAFSVAYGLKSPEEANGPVAEHVEFKPDAVYVTCKYADGGFEIRGGELTGFELAPFKHEVHEEDFVKAQAEILENGQIRVFAPSLPNPGSIRYLWSNWADVTLYGKNGIPLEPFRA